MAVTDCWQDCIKQEAATIGCFECIFQAILNILVQVGGILVFIMFIVGGIRFLTAGGDPKKAVAAWQVLTYAVVGLVMVILAWFILLFIKKFTGVDVTKFRIIIPSP